MDRKETQSFLEDSQADNVRVVLVDLNGIARGKRLPIEKFLSACDHGINFSSGIYNFMCDSDLVPELPTVGFSTGFQDILAHPNLNTLTLIPWEEKTAWVMCDLCQLDGSPLLYDPRVVLKNQVEKLGNQSLKPIVGMEYEVFVLEETPDSLIEKKWSDLKYLYPNCSAYDQVRSTKSRFFMEDIWRMMPDAGVPLDSIQVEQGGGMFEFPIKEADALTAADRAVLFKVGVKEICHKHGLLASFMPKIDERYEGLSGAVHHSVVDSHGKNLFADEKRENGLSRFFESWCEGLLRNLLDLTLIYLPNINSYKRPIPGWFVGNSTTWAVESRATTLRVINYHPPATRIENRLPGADGNPYLVIAAHLAAGMDGIENKLDLRPPFTEGDPAMAESEHNDVDYIPQSLACAVELFKNSRQSAEFFGSAFHRTFIAHREHEVELARKRVADWERERYLENI